MKLLWQRTSHLFVKLNWQCTFHLFVKLLWGRSGVILTGQLKSAIMNCGTQSARVATSILKESNKIKKITKLNQLANKQTHQTRNKQTKETYSNQKCKKFTNATNAGNKQTNQQVNNLYATQCNYFNMSECTHVRRRPCSFQSIVTWVVLQVLALWSPLVSHGAVSSSSISSLCIH